MKATATLCVQSSHNEKPHNKSKKPLQEITANDADNHFYRHTPPKQKYKYVPK